jgi:hypothetical protein
MPHNFRKPKPISEGMEEIVAAKWQQRRRVASMIAALIDVSTDRMEKEIRGEFQNIDNAVRTLAFDNQAQQSATPKLATRHSSLATPTGHRPLATGHCSSATGHCILQNEPKLDGNS